MRLVFDDFFLRQNIMRLFLFKGNLTVKIMTVLYAKFI